MKPATRSLLTIIALALSVVGCGGGSSGDSGLPSGDPGSPNEPNTQIPSSGSFNGGLTGRVITTYKDEPVQLDLSTGLMAELPVDTVHEGLVRNGQSTEDSRSRRSYFIAGGTSSIQYVQTVPECFTNELFISENDSCIAIFDSGFQKIEEFRLTGIELLLAGKISPTGRFLALNDYIGVVGEDPRSTILWVDAATHTTIDSVALDVGDRLLGTDPSPLAWTPDEALVYTVPSDERTVVYITEPGSLELANSISLPASYQGEVVSLEVSPDGSKLLMGYDPRQGLDRGGVLLLDLVTLQISVPAVGPSEASITPLLDNITSNIRAPQWSPDGQWIMVIEGTGRFFGDGVFTNERLYAVPASESRTILSTDTPSDAILISVIYPDGDGEIRDIWLADDIFQPEFSWVN